MTKANIFADAIANVANSRDISATNAKRMSALALLARNENVEKLLTDANVDVSRFNSRAIYATEKCVKIVHAIAKDETSASDLNANAFAAFKTAIVRAEKDQKITSDDLRASLSKDFKHDKKREIYRRDAILSASTLNAQSQQVIDMLKTLRVMKETAKNVFEIDTENAIFKRAKERLADIASV